MELTQLTNQVAYLIGVEPKSKRVSRFVLDSVRTQASTEAARANNQEQRLLFYSILSAAICIAHAVNSGRLSGNALCTWREMKEYMQCRVIAGIAAQYMATGNYAPIAANDEGLVAKVREAIL